MKPVHVIGVPLDLGGNRRGVDMGPSAFRIAGLAEQLIRQGHTIVDKGDLPTPIPETTLEDHDARKKYIRAIAKVCSKLYQTALESLAEGAIPLVLGGDHSLGAGSVSAAWKWAKRARRPADRPAVDRRPRRHEHAGDNVERQRPACRWRRCSAGNHGLARIGALRPRSFPNTPCCSACATSTSVKKSRSAIRVCTSSL
jgi:hypothetical protein